MIANDIQSGVLNPQKYFKLVLLWSLFDLADQSNHEVYRAQIDSSEFRNSFEDDKLSLLSEAFILNAGFMDFIIKKAFNMFYFLLIN